jgi:hypothetical protein
MSDWWGLKEGGVMGAKYSLPFDDLHGFRVNKTTAEVFGKIAEYKTVLGEKDEIFAYPSIPIAYLLLNKMPPIKLPTLWFDVSDRSQLGGVVKDLEQKMPSVIFWLRPPDFVYNGHAELRRLPSLISGVDDWLYEKIISGQYQVESALSLNVDDSWKLRNPDIREPTSVKIFVTHPGVTCDQVRKLNGVVSADCVRGNTLDLGSIYSVTFINHYWQDQYINVIGFPYSSDDAHIFIVLRRG